MGRGAAVHGIITVDAGTTSMRSILFDEAGRVLAAFQRDNPPHHFPDGRVEQDADSWRISLVELLSKCATAVREHGADASCVALTSQRSSVIPVERTGEPLHAAIMWQDQRTEALCRELAGSDRLVYRKTGLRISPVFSAIKMTWLRRARPDLLRRAHKLVGIHDYLLHQMTGHFLTDRSLASRTNLLDLETREWDPALLELFAVERSQLCDLLEPGSAAGGLTPEMARATGLPQGLPVVSAGGDQQCAALGLGLLSPGRMVANAGTGSYVIGFAARPALDPEMRLSCTVAALPGSYMVEAGMLSSGSLYGWFRDRFCSGAEGFAQVNREAAGSPPGANGVLLLPHFKGAGAPHWNPGARGLFFGLSLGTVRGDMARAVLEGIAAEMAENVEIIERLTGAVEELRVSGGLTNLPVFNQIQADMYRRRVVRSADAEATARGAWMSAAVNLGLYRDHATALSAREAAAKTEGGQERANPSEGEYRPDPATAELYSRLRERARVLYRALEGSGIYALPPLV
jgi:glycerol kinase